MKCLIIPVIIGATGMVTKDYEKYGGHISTKDCDVRNITQCGKYCGLKLEP
jgi:hypothetical protein